MKTTQNNPIKITLKMGSEVRKNKEEIAKTLISIGKKYPQLELEISCEIPILSEGSMTAVDIEQAAEILAELAKKYKSEVSADFLTAKPKDSPEKVIKRFLKETIFNYSPSKEANVYECGGGGSICTFIAALLCLSKKLNKKISAKFNEMIFQVFPNDTGMKVQRRYYNKIKTKSKKRRMEK